METFVWVVQILLALAFFMAGIMKLTQPIDKLETRLSWIESINPRNMVRGIGLVEVLGALGLILPAVTGILPVLTPLAAAPDSSDDARRSFAARPARGCDCPRHAVGRAAGAGGLCGIRAVRRRAAGVENESLAGVYAPARTISDYLNTSRTARRIPAVPRHHPAHRPSQPPPPRSSSGT
ncbi:MAG: DoxX family protein [Anaerolineae bacterium]